MVVICVGWSWVRLFWHGHTKWLCKLSRCGRMVILFPLWSHIYVARARIDRPISRESSASPDLMIEQCTSVQSLMLIAAVWIQLAPHLSDSQVAAIWAAYSGPCWVQVSLCPLPLAQQRLGSSMAWSKDDKQQGRSNWGGYRYLYPQNQPK